MFTDLSVSLSQQLYLSISLSLSLSVGATARAQSCRCGSILLCRTRGRHRFRRVTRVLVQYQLLGCRNGLLSSVGPVFLVMALCIDRYRLFLYH